MVAPRTVLLRALWAVVFAAALASWWSGRGAELAAVVAALGYGLVMLTFARTLRRGREPLITRFCRLHYGRVPAECLAYTRRFTALWAGLTGAFGLEMIVLALLGRNDWVGTANLFNAALMIALFVGEHALRARLFPHLPVGSPLSTGRIVLQAWRSR